MNNNKQQLEINLDSIFKTDSQYLKIYILAIIIIPLFFFALHNESDSLELIFFIFTIFSIPFFIFDFIKSKTYFMYVTNEEIGDKHFFSEKHFPYTSLVELGCTKVTGANRYYPIITYENNDGILNIFKPEYPVNLSYLKSHILKINSHITINNEYVAGINKSSLKYYWSKYMS